MAKRVRAKIPPPRKASVSSASYAEMAASRILFASSLVSIRHPDVDVAEARRRRPVAGRHDLPRLPLPAVGDWVHPQVGSHGVDGHEVISAVRGDAAVPVEPAQLAVLDLIDL